MEAVRRRATLPGGCALPVGHRDEEGVLAGDVQVDPVASRLQIRQGCEPPVGRRRGGWGRAVDTAQQRAQEGLGRRTRGSQPPSRARQRRRTRLRSRGCRGSSPERRDWPPLPGGTDHLIQTPAPQPGLHLVGILTPNRQRAPREKAKWWNKAWKAVKGGAKAAWRYTKRGAAWLTDSKAGKLLNTACGFAWGAVAAACSGVYAAAYAVQGRWGAAAKTAAIGLGSAVGGGAAMRAVAKSGVAVARNAKYAKRGARIRGVSTAQNRTQCGAAKAALVVLR